jgi:hypothetical protein
MRPFVTSVLIACAALAGTVGCSGSNHGRATSESSRPAPGPHAEAIRRGVEFLVSNQQPDGSWGSGLETRGYEIYAMVPGSHDAYRVATTALCVMALREAGEKSAHDRGVEYLITSGEARRDSGDILYNVWAHTYALEALAIEMRHSDDARVARMAQWHLDQMVRYATYMGGWNYYDFDAQTQQPSMDPTSFGTAAALVALHEARESGLEVPQRLIDLSINRLLEARLPNGVFLYGSGYKYVPQMPGNQIKGAVGRTQPCNYALALFGSALGTPEHLKRGLDLFFEYHDFLEMGRKRQWPHESWYQTSGYYYYFDHYYAAKLIERLGESDRNHYYPKLSAVVAPHQEPDGSWWDYAMWDYHKPYGTAFAIMTLLRCDVFISRSVDIT